MSDHRNFFAELEAKGEDDVRIDLAKGIYASGNKPKLVTEWLASKERDRESCLSNKRDAREEETLTIAKEANRLATEANAIARIEAAAASRSARYAMYAAIIAAVTAIIATKDQIFALIFGNP